MFKKAAMAVLKEVKTEASNSSMSVRVMARFRPKNDREKKIDAEGLDDSGFKVDFVSAQSIVFSKYDQTASFTFDYVLNSNENQATCYDVVAKQTIMDILQGFNGTIFAYGQTGSGKTFTMMGPDMHSPDMAGIIPRSCDYMFECIENDTENSEYTIKCSYMEIYNEEIYDLFSGAKQGLKVREVPNKGPYVEGLQEMGISSPDEMYDLLEMGGSNRATAATAMNAQSSRSHSVFVILLKKKCKDGSTREGHLNLVDLAGSEKVGKTGATGSVLDEAKSINKSLSALGNCIKALASGSTHTHIPYRDSKLTRILQESLGGNCKTTLMIACSPHSDNYEETLSTLRFGARAKTIKNKVKINAQRSAGALEKLVAQLEKEVESLKQQIAQGGGGEHNAILADSWEKARREKTHLVQELRNELEAEKNELDDVEQERQENTRTIEKLEEDMAAMKVKAAEEKSRREKLTAELEAIKKETADLRAEDKKLNRDAAKLQVDLDKAKRAAERVQVRASDDKKTGTAKLQTQTEELEKRLAAKEQEARKAMAHEQQLRRDLELKVDANHTLAQQFEALRKELLEVKDERERLESNTELVVRAATDTAIIQAAHNRRGSMLSSVAVAGPGGRLSIVPQRRGSSVNTPIKSGGGVRNSVLAPIGARNSVVRGALQSSVVPEADEEDEEALAEKEAMATMEANIEELRVSMARITALRQSLTAPIR